MALLVLLISLLLRCALCALSPDALPGLYRLRVGNDGNPRCGDLLVIKSGDVMIPSTEIVIDDVPCSEGALFLVTNPPHGNTGLVAAFSKIPNTGDFLAGEPVSPLVCGPVRYGSGNTLIFMRPNTDFTITWTDIVATGTALEAETASIFTFEREKTYVIVNNRCMFIRDDSDPVVVPDDGSVCFPMSATVHTEHAGRKRMDQLQLGDRVYVGMGRYSEIVAWTYRDRSKSVREYVSIDVGGERNLTLTPGHVVYVQGRPMKARDVRVGHRMHSGEGHLITVRAVTTVNDMGLFNPQTMHGDIVVDGVLVSTYTETINQSAAHALLAPVRALCMAGLPAGLGDKMVGTLAAKWHV